MTGKQDGFAVIFQEKQNGMCVICWHIPFCSWGGFQRRATPPLALGHPIGARSIPVGGGIQRGRRFLWPEESKETGGFVAGNPTGTASPWHTTLLAKYSVLYLHPRLTGKRSVSTMERSFCSAGKRAGFLRVGTSKNMTGFKRGAGI